MNNIIALLAAAGLSLLASGCATPQNYNNPPYSYGGYGSNYPGYNNPNYSGYNNPYSSGYNRQRDQEKKEPTLQEKQVKALKDAAKNGADPASTLYQQMLIQQSH